MVHGYHLSGETVACSHNQICPNGDCKKIVTIFIDDDSIPSMSDAYIYTCPHCEAQVVFYPNAVVLGVGIPEDGVIAEPYEP